MPSHIKAVLILPFLFFALIIQSAAQNVLIKGRVIDSDTRDALAFVSIQVENGTEGCISDIDGMFKLQTSKPVARLYISYIGYEPLVYTLDKTEKDIVI
ncbi:MAG TPA: carboxypeptidase-like regulatory domain-containing protein, partial [Bacteroidales bacterium]|nr:carboxypeptidase-like regulatory domain-containing protein [Bacteroidales bacterium]